MVNLDSDRSVDDDDIELRADLHDANLSGADLSSAKLFNADLSGADLCGANVATAMLTQTTVEDHRGQSVYATKRILHDLGAVIHHTE